jgi:small subunit ribosomal protein S2
MKENQDKKNFNLDLEKKLENNHKADTQNIENSEDTLAKKGKTMSDLMETKEEKKAFPVTIEDLFESGAQLGHSPSRTHPKMKEYIYGILQGIHVFNLDITLVKLKEACEFLKGVSSKKGKILWVGTKTSTTELSMESAKKSSGLYISKKWIPGLLTNFKTFKTTLENIHKKESISRSMEYTKRDRLMASREVQKFNTYYEGMKDVGFGYEAFLPKAIVILDVASQPIAVAEAKRLNIPIVGITDTNTSPEIDYFIPANDDSIKCVSLIANTLTNYIIEGMKDKVHTNKFNLNRNPNFKFNGERGNFEGRPFERKPFERKPFERKPFERKPFERKPFERKPFERKPFNKEATTTSEPAVKKVFEKKPFSILNK